MKIEDLEELKFTTISWVLLSGKAKWGYMLGYLACKKQVKELLEAENLNNEN